MDDEGELIDQLDSRWLDSDPDPGSGDDSKDDSENDPEWDFEEGETRVKDATYVFCPENKTFISSIQVSRNVTRVHVVQPNSRACCDGNVSVLQAAGTSRSLMVPLELHGIRHADGNFGHAQPWHLHTSLDDEQRWEQKTSGSNSPSPHASSSPRPSSMDSYSQSHSLVHFSCGSSRRHSSFWAAQNHSRRIRSISNLRGKKFAEVEVSENK